MPFTQTNDVPVYYEVKGPEKPADTLVFAHGAGGNAAIWFNQIAYFASRYRVIAFDHRGFGRTRLPEAPLTVQQFRDDLITILDETEVESAHLVGQSMGGFTVLRTTLDAQERVRSLTFSATSGGIYTPTPSEAVGKLTSSGDRNASGVKDTMSVATKASAELMQLYESINNFNTDFAWSNLASLLGDGGVVQWETLAQVQVPTIFIAGAEDPLFPSETLASFVPNFPDARIEVVRDAGHSPYFEQPDVFNRILEEHIQSAM